MDSSPLASSLGIISRGVFEMHSDITDIQSEPEDIKTDRQTLRQADRQTDRQTDRQKERVLHRHRKEKGLTGMNIFGMITI